MKNVRLFFIVVLFLSACSLGGAETPATEAAVTQPVEAPPTAIPTPIAPPLVVLLAAPEADPSLVTGAQQVLEQAAAQAGLTFEYRQALDLAALPENLQLVVVLPPAPGLAELVAAAPGVQFLALVVPGLPQAPNLTEITAGGQRAIDEGFMAGYITAVQTEDYRVGSISSFAEPDYRQGFVTGVRFFCGLCRQLYPPFYDYPLTVEISANPAAAEWQVAADQLVAASVQTVYIAPDVSDPALFEYLAQSGVNLVGGVLPPESARANWLLRVHHDVLSTLQQVLPLVLQGGAQGQVSAALVLDEVNQNQVGTGRVMHFEEVIGRLEAGIIDPTGE